MKILSPSLSVETNRAKRPVYQEIFKLAIPYLKNCRPEDLLHTRVVVSLVEEIIKGENLGSQADILIPAAILHDIGWSQLDEEGKVKRPPRARVKHMKEGVRIAQKILKSMGYPKEKMKEICQLISVHDNQYLGLPVKDELAKRLIEADNLWLLTKEAFDFYCQKYNLSRKSLLERHWAHIERFQSIHSPTAVKIKNKLIEKRRQEAL